MYGLKPVPFIAARTLHPNYPSRVYGGSQKQLLPQRGRVEERGKLLVFFGFAGAIGGDDGGCDHHSDKRESHEKIVHRCSPSAEASGA